ncbi:MAG: hypothetical protein P8Y02_10925 [Deinococcales bacterium]
MAHGQQSRQRSGSGRRRRTRGSHGAPGARQEAERAPVPRQDEAPADVALDEALEETFPASDPVAIAIPETANPPGSSGAAPSPRRRRRQRERERR